MKIEEFNEEFRVKYKSSHPIIAIETFEEDWCMDSLRTFVFNSKASTDKRKLEGVITWSRALGFDTKIKAATEEGLPELNITNPESVTVPSVALKHIYRYCQSKKVEPMMFILRDLSEDIKQNPDVQRWIRECF